MQQSGVCTADLQPMPWQRVPALAAPLGLPYQLTARITNAALTAQVQITYACATAAAEQAEHAADAIERSWPDTPLRTLAVRGFRAQALDRRRAARDILHQARRRCGLAYARL